nr:hypothetical protein HAGR004_01150 [Bdellovibrio sp. HAGR004]BFD65098.1 hypothetical protein HAGR004_01200 [Bdellovibrio sp. HAGR004]BFD65101.1 hypothetical protein HAGR004_01230 [Bdellovibrio sp. HAGR004]BFD65104.1 hypothetical protein HAGR004_01260 [Bdellovibrio sp. HAGR004]
MKKTILTMATLLMATSAFATQYECGVMERQYTGANKITGEKDSATEKQCGSAILDTEKEFSAFFNCGQGISLSLIKSDMSFVLTNRTNQAGNEATYFQLSVLESGSPQNWQHRRPVNNTVIEAKSGLSSDFVMVLGLDKGGLVHEKSISYYAVCSKK